MKIVISSDNKTATIITDRKTFTLYDGNNNIRNLIMYMYGNVPLTLPTTENIISTYTRSLEDTAVSDSRRTDPYIHHHDFKKSA